MNNLTNKLSWGIDAHICMYPLQSKDAGAVHQLISNNRAHLDQWLRWSSAIQTLQDAQQLVSQFEEKLKQGDGFMNGIWHKGELAGAVVCWYINRHNNNTEIGYWLGTEFTGKGLVTRACEKVIGYLFEEEGLHRIEMQCGVENLKSRAVPERLGFELEGIRRDSHWITDRYVDHSVYGLLNSTKVVGI